MTLIKQIKQIVESKKMTQRELAQQAGINAGALSAYLKGNYAGDNESIEKALRGWLATQEKKVREFVEPPSFIDIPTAQKVFKALDMAKICKIIAPIYGASGVGKTKAAQTYKTQNKNVWMVTASPARATLSAILYELALSLGINDAPRRKDRLSRLVTEKMRGTDGLVIVDESDHLPYDALEELRIIQEEADVGFALIGNDKVYTRMQGGINQAHEYARLWSRLGKPSAFKGSTKGDIKAIAQAWGLDVDDKDLMTVLYEIGSKAGGLRALTQYLRLAGMTAKGQGTVITLDLIFTAQAQMTGGTR
ncbi:AAA family ATPase [Avibacterium paragallinarum]|uniref:AAA family ATPase n=1 Tax=Avibacterium paragallinarum TaxID=728 RepID=UPI0021F7C868|nr:AAA family ATPase [Avibacterium paragallinarum]UXN35475.1 AAA family ATPase [Avibacterium paragallinarum]